MDNYCLQRIEASSTILGLFELEGKGVEATEECDNVHLEEEEGPSEGVKERRLNNERERERPKEEEACSPTSPLNQPHSKVA